jgi:hypothetical protein
MNTEVKVNTSTTDFVIDGVRKSYSIAGSPEFKLGQDVLLSTAETDITFGQPWYPDGYAVKDFLTSAEFQDLKQGLTESIGRIIQAETGLDTHGFSLEQYHRFVTTDGDHFKVVGKTADLFSHDFSFSVMDLLPRISGLLGVELTDMNPRTGKKLHIIVRINRPGSTDFNPPHKDIYQAVDNENYIPQFVNFWIPICGVPELSNLPLAPGSHLINEQEVLRTFEGGRIEGHNYRVRMVKSWKGGNELERSTVKHGQILMFTSHLIHGLASNDAPDTTRVALEFRLFKKG